VAGDPELLKSERLLELERKAELLARVSSAARVGFWEWDPATDETEWDPAMREIAGVGRDAEVSIPLWLGMVHPDDREAAQEATDSRHSDGEFQHRIVRPDGQVRHVIVRSEQIEPELEASPYMGVVIDVTESQEASSLVVDILESISDAYLGVGHDWRFTYVNRQTERLLGQPRGELLGRSLWEAFPDAVGSPYEIYRIAMEQRKPVELEQFYEPMGSWFEIRAFPVESGIAIYFRDVSERHEAEAEREKMLEEEQRAREDAETARRKVEHQATHDSLTNLSNRTELMRRLDGALAEGVPVTLLFFDIDRFKLVNDSLGHATGDRLLRIIAERLSPFKDSRNLVARFGGDEFVIALFGKDDGSASLLADRVLAAVRVPVDLDGNKIHTTASIGMAASRGEMRANDLLLNADVALYRAKDAGRDRAVWFDEELHEQLLRRVDLEQRLRKAIDRGQIGFHFQPAFDLHTGKVSDVEALARWNDPDEGAISPVEFIPIAEESGLIHRIGRAAIDTVAEVGASWENGGPGPVTFWANVSASQLSGPEAGSGLKSTLDHLGMDPTRFGIEITESALAESKNSMDGLQRVAELGIKVAVDDFGTGYSSISRLSELPVDILKIDRSFTRKIGLPGGVKTISAIVDLAHALDATVIAEGIETEAQLHALRETRCDRASGFLMARPVPVEGLAGAIEAGERALLQ